MKKNSLIIIIVFFGSLTLLFLFTFLKRISLPYNAEGNYFDEENLVTYKVQVAEAYGIAAFAGLLFTGIFLYKLITSKKRTNTQT